MGKKRKKKLQRTFIRDWRKHRGLTQAQLADRVDMAQGSISDLERGDFAYTQPMLEAIADALTCKPWDLIWRPPGAVEGLQEVFAMMDPAEQERAVAVIKAMRGKAA